MFSLNTILLHCEAKDKDTVIQTIADHAVKIGLVSDAKAYVASVQHRESEFSTGVGYGIAIPHGKTEAVNTAFVIYAKVNNVEWNSFDGAPVDLVFQIGVPASDAGETHLRLLATLSRKLMKEEFREAIRNAKNKQAVLDVFAAFELV
jgi:fructose-specific phosphotransferase system IIA component